MSHTIEFHDYVNQLPSWERNLLQNILFHYGGAFNTMAYLHELNPDECFLYEVSDGSMANNTTTFGWMIGTPTGQRLIWGSGPGYGPATSHRAECWGKLSAVRFLHHLSLFTKQPFPATLQIMSLADNKGLVTSLQRRMTYETVYPNATLKSDWDLIEEIYQTYTQIPSIRVTFDWIKGHQDYDKAYDRLSIPAQYNVDADTLANAHMEEDGNYRPTSSSTPASRCIFQINKRTIHGHYIPEIREAASVPALRAYLRSRHHWSPKTLKSIQWKWFQLAANNYTHTDNHLTKLVHDQLPTQTYKAKQGGQPWLPTKCRYCNTGADETFEHLLRCDHQYSQRFRKTLPLTVLQYCTKRKTPHNFHVTLVIALEDLLRDKPPLESIEAGQAVLKLIHAQKAIGWSHLLRGFFSDQWHKYLEYELNHNPAERAPDYFDYASFFSGLIKLIWSQQSTLWNDLQRPAGPDSPPVPSLDRIEEHKIAIRHLYTLRSQVLPQHRDEYFPRHLSDFLNRSTPTQLLNYINNYKHAIGRSVKLAKQRSIHSNPIFTFPGFQRRSRHLSSAASTVLLSDSAPSTSTATSTHHPVSSFTSSSSHPGSYLDSLPSCTSHTSHTVATTVTHRPRVQHTLANWFRPSPLSTNAMSRIPRERPPHKHSRWKPVQAAQAAFRAFFSTSTTPPPSSL
jgi:hypothetical protein